MTTKELNSAAQAAMPDEPDMLWDAEDAENCYGDGPEDFANNYASNCMIGGDACEVDVLCAYRGSTRTMRIELAKNPHDEELENPVLWSWVNEPASAPPSPQPVAESFGGLSACACCGAPEGEWVVRPNDVLQPVAGLTDAEYAQALILAKDESDAWFDQQPVPPDLQAAQAYFARAIEAHIKTKDSK